jgi:hypothetical protein
MPEDKLSVKDMLAAVSADIDQAQARIDEARSNTDDPIFLQQLEMSQFQLDTQRETVKILTTLDNIVDPHG